MQITPCSPKALEEKLIVEYDFAIWASPDGDVTLTIEPPINDARVAIIFRSSKEICEFTCALLATFIESQALKAPTKES